MIKTAKLEEMTTVTQLANALWPTACLDGLTAELKQIIINEDTEIFLAYVGDEAIGFAQCSLRYDYVEGTESAPVGYLEGLYVKDTFRKQNIAHRLVEKCEVWTKDKGSSEFASDCELDNEISLTVHLKLGFKEVNRIICFRKEL